MKQKLKVYFLFNKIVIYKIQILYFDSYYIKYIILFGINILSIQVKNELD